MEGTFCSAMEEDNRLILGILTESLTLLRYATGNLGRF